MQALRHITGYLRFFLKNTTCPACFVWFTFLTLLPKVLPDIPFMSSLSFGRADTRVAKVERHDDGSLISLTNGHRDQNEKNVPMTITELKLHNHDS